MTIDQDTVIGASAVAAGSTGLTVQIITDYAHLGVIMLNAVLAIGGLYLLSLKIRKARRELK